MYVLENSLWLLHENGLRGDCSKDDNSSDNAMRSIRSLARVLKLGFLALGDGLKREG